MYQVCIQRHFDAAHYLRNYGGKCENLHGHRWQIVVAVNVDELNETELAFDFTELKRVVDDVLIGFDHVCLNDTSPFDVINATSENIARVIYERVAAALPGVRVAHITAYESPDAWVTYSK
ncbi:MAG: 6-carboxytetrahydropterin synthase QueD [Chloroflexi bacterium]|nr:6-carboxytetrahydropterin synthase QueD [Chloroflexota bacterium]